MLDIEKYTTEKIIELKDSSRFREVYNSEQLEGAYIKKKSKKLISFSCNDYLGLNDNKKVVLAVKKALDKYGSGAVASRLITGNNVLYSKLEKELARLHETESATVFSSGYSANFGTVKALMEEGDLIILDRLSHNCLIEGAIASKSEIMRFKHNNYEDLEKILTKKRKDFNKCLIITESVFSMDGDRANLEVIRKLAAKYHAWLLVDYAHDIEIFTQKRKNNFKNEIKIGTFSKALAGLGGYVCGSQKLIKYLNSKAGNLIFSTGLPPSVLAGNLMALKLAVGQKKIVKKATENALYFKVKLKGKFDFSNSESQIVPIIIGDTDKTIELSEKLEKFGFLLHPIKPPTVPENKSRLRVSFSTKHTKKQIDSLILALEKINIA